eukprot:m.105125 g.105125  ORF g.105125 m.105125 type:complete len:434 (-) comp51632_c0_seq1:76-1377(-)
MVPLLLLAVLACLPLACSANGARSLMDRVRAESWKQGRGGALCANGAFVLAESIPVGVNLTTNLTTTDSWTQLLNNAKVSVHIAAFYMTLTGGDADGQLVYNAILGAATRGVPVQIAISAPSDQFPDSDLLDLLAASTNIQASYVNMTDFFGSGVQHSKFIVVDGTNFYLGSANLDWRSLTQVKELGMHVESCSDLALDLDKIFQLFWLAGSLQALPAQWPASMDTQYNAVQPANVTLNGSTGSVYITTAPAGFCPPNRTYDLSSIGAVMAGANQTICIEVMDYLPAVAYDPKGNYYWPDIDNMIRSADYRGIKVRMLMAYWNYSFPGEQEYLQSLDVLSNVEVKYLIIPIIEPYVPYTRVNHAKYMVTDQMAFISTSNWVGDYFISTAGASIVSNHTTVISELQGAFDRDWNSIYAENLPSPNPNPCMSDEL